MIVFTMFQPMHPSDVSYRIQEPTENFEPDPLFNPQELIVLIPLTMTGYNC